MQPLRGRSFAVGEAGSVGQRPPGRCVAAFQGQGQTFSRQTRSLLPGRATCGPEPVGFGHTCGRSTSSIECAIDRADFTGERLFVPWGNLCSYDFFWNAEIGPETGGFWQNPWEIVIEPALVSGHSSQNMRTSLTGQVLAPVSADLCPHRLIRDVRGGGVYPSGDAIDLEAKRSCCSCGPTASHVRLSPSPTRQTCFFPSTCRIDDRCRGLCHAI